MCADKQNSFFHSGDIKFVLLTEYKEIVNFWLRTGKITWHHLVIVLMSCVVAAYVMLAIIDIINNI